MKACKGSLSYVLMGTLLVCYAAWCGLGKTPDSLNYLAAAKSLWTSGVLTDIHGDKLTLWPPLYPFVLAPFQGIEPWILLLHLFLFTGTMIFWYQITAKEFKSPWLQKGFMLGLCIGTPLLEAHIFIWSEGLFIFLLSGAFLLLKKYSLYQKRIDFIGLICCSALLCLQRNLGILCVWGIGITLLGNTRAVLKTIQYYIITLIPWMGWQIRNYILDGEWQSTAFVFRSEQGTYQVLKGIGSWIVPHTIPVALQTILISAILIGTVYACWRQNHLLLKHTLVVGGTYLFGLWLLQPVDTEIGRYLIPAYIPCLAAATLTIDFWILHKKPLKMFLLLLFVLWVTYSGIRTVKNVLFWNQQRCQEDISLNISRY